MLYSDAIAARATGRRKSAAISDEVLVGLIAQGDKDAMEALYRRHNVRVFRFLLRFVDGEATAEDLVSEVFLEAWRKAGADTVKTTPDQYRAQIKQEIGQWKPLIGEIAEKERN